MKNLVKLMLAILLTAGLSSCQKIKSIFDVEFDTTLSGDLDIDIQEPVKKSVDSYVFESWADVDPLEDDDIAEYQEKIKDFDVKTVLAEVLYINKGGVTFYSGTSFIIKDDLDEISWTLADDWAVEEGTTITLGDIGDIYKSVGNVLSRKKKFKVGAVGTCSETGVSITLRIGIDTKVTANPL